MWGKLVITHFLYHFYLHTYPLLLCLLPLFLSPLSTVSLATWFLNPHYKAQKCTTHILDVCTWLRSRRAECGKTGCKCQSCILNYIPTNRWTYKLKTRQEYRPALNIESCGSHCIYRRNILPEKISVFLNVCLLERYLNATNQLIQNAHLSSISNVPLNICLNEGAAHPGNVYVWGTGRSKVAQSFKY